MHAYLQGPCQVVMEDPQADQVEELQKRRNSNTSGVSVLSSPALQDAPTTVTSLSLVVSKS